MDFDILEWNLQMRANQMRHKFLTFQHPCLSAFIGGYNCQGITIRLNNT